MTGIRGRPRKHRRVSPIRSCAGPGRYAAHDRVRRYVFRHDRPGRYDGMIADGHSAQDRSVRPDPYPFPEYDRRVVQVLPVCGPEAVVEGGHDHAMPDQTAVADKDAALVLKLATGVDKHIPPYMDVFPKSV